ncbi:MULTISPECIES: hypothetical protein [unclassified Streptomyces]|uniref:hypothetical protein n=1 Tax=unclassified Streptomyces TaxID=2593676 RepID=UPI001CB70ED4|nr:MULTISPECIES: hypothetical protein [unclassified Streptomyces]MBD0710966.1 hypothetical protein [Streptomyces sp. CBMA291]MBD0717501.1 hypothetical protein [Streptomyces sp. CBMA370]
MAQSIPPIPSDSPPGLPSGAPPPAPPGAPPAVPGRDPATSEATRLLCAGTYLDPGYRDAVIDELYVHEERFAAPSSGFDATRVLAHALRARRIELGWSIGILALWLVAIPLTAGLVILLFYPFLLLALARWVRGPAAVAPLYRSVPAFVLRWYGRLMLVLSVLVFLFLLLGTQQNAGEMFVSDSGELDVVGGLLGTGAAAASALQGLITLAVPFLIAWAVAIQQGQFARALTEELSRGRFPDRRSDPAEQAEGVRFRRLRDLVRIEQGSALVLYDEADPFCGAGEPYEPWSLSVELRPREDLDGEPEPLDNSTILRHVVPLLEALREPSPRGTPQDRDAVRDRLRELELDEVVFLPVDGLPARTAAPYGPESFERHRSDSIEEGGEARRYFLRIRVGGWDGEVVTTVFVRVHTQGGMLMLEVAPHVLRPVKPLYRQADRVAHRFRHNHFFGRAVWALEQTPRSAGQSLITIGRALGNAWRLLTGGHARALPEGPRVSVRELGSDGTASLFQDMDVSRHLKSVQDRVASGVLSALREAGYRTTEFEQQIVQVAEGGLFIQNDRGNMTVGNNNNVTQKSFTTTNTGGDRG